MLSKTKSKSKTVSEKVAELILNPNGDDESCDESDEEATAPKVAEYDEDIYELPDPRTSEFRKRNATMLSEQSVRYRGKITSRRDFESEGSEDDDRIPNDEENESEVNEATEDESSTQSGQNQHISVDETKSESFSSTGEEESDDETDGIVEHEESDDNMDIGKEKNAPHIFTESSKEVEVAKGVCVQNQLNIWEKLLELRIHSQKLLCKANVLPEPSVLQQEQKENKAVMNLTNECEVNVTKLIGRMLELQRSLYLQFSEIKTTLKGVHKRSLPHSTDSPPSKRFAEHLEQNFSEFKPYRNTVLLKWDDRTKLLTPGAGSKKKSLNEEHDIVQKINNTLQNRISMIEKSQILKYERSAALNMDANTTETDILVKRNVYDDTDFYHQQLRELIEYKASSSTNASEVTKQLIELQKLRQKMKKKVDTRASKGRKIRYVVHKKLSNFMAPNDQSDWTAESQNELYKSLFAS